MDLYNNEWVWVPKVEANFMASHVRGEKKKLELLNFPQDGIKSPLNAKQESQTSMANTHLPVN